MDIQDNVKAEILRDQIARWENTFYLATVNHEIGKTVGDNNMIAAAVAEMKKCRMATDVLKKKLSAIAVPAPVDTAIPSVPESQDCKTSA